ncbi:sortase [Pseudoscardovia radai]|uniref:Sortase n=2 Tax=Pseudoscardovia radai TaxID=987066 RepID=A0A261EZ94_9BIFI|nr:sortase [Pseudoscardovia radai]
MIRRSDSDRPDAVAGTGAALRMPENAGIRGGTVGAGDIAGSGDTVGGDGTGESGTMRNDGGAAAPDFDSLIVDLPHRRRQRRLRRYLRLLRMLIVLLVAASLILGLYPVFLQMQSAKELADVADNAQTEVSRWPTDRVKQMLADAQAYNERLARSGQPQIGSTSALSGVGSATASADSAADAGTAASDPTPDMNDTSNGSSYADYLSLLDAGDGVMATVRVPSISVDLPVYHGTSDRVLAVGAGHLYGTSLPVGGPSTHTVITGHRGLTDAEMFTRLNEMRKGDSMYLEVLGETLAYQVDAIWIINPDDTSLLRVTPGEDRLTLMTCTPYGVNTQRLLVSGHRVEYPGAAPDPTTVWDERKGLMVAIAAIGVVTVAVLLVEVRRGRWYPRRHWRET